MAEALLVDRPAYLVAVGGFSGTGKSTLAYALAPHMGRVPGAVVLRSDEIRKRLLGVDARTRLGADGYAPEVSGRVYATLAGRTAAVARGGYAAVADAVFARPSDRAAIEAAAAATGVPFVGLWLEAPEALLVARVTGRGQDASDADASVVRAQLAEDAGGIAWHRLDASADPARVLARARSFIDESVRRADSTQGS
jgi:predicted kinase